MRLGIVLYSRDPETVWNAFRFGVFALAQGDEVRLFLLGKGVEALNIKDERFNVKEQMDTFLENGGKIVACGVCLEVRDSKEGATCPVGSMNDLYELVMWADKTVSF
ncbi:MAG TPA: sulfur reduction protein DsrE [Aquificaceae bacterium]|nr:sulfur reduction protein DsrE [Aquificaceae bacterium]